VALTFDISGLSPDVRRELVAGEHVRRVADREDAFHRQARIAREAGEHRSLDGLGRVRMMIDPTSYHYWGDRLGYQCWKDRAFLREFERDNADVRVKCGGTKIMVGWTPSVKRFQKVYLEGHSL
jgi:hypothetical protein